MGIVKTILDITGYIITITFIGGLISGIILWIKGIFPVLYRLGKGLAGRKIAIFAKDNNLNSLRDLLIHSGLFYINNIYSITGKESFGIMEKATVYLVYWPDFKDEIEQIVDNTKDGTALIIYAPHNLGIIPEDQMEKINSKRNAAVSNFRGRLLNDIVTSMITTSF